METPATRLESTSRGVRWHGVTISIAIALVVLIAAGLSVMLAASKQYFPKGALDPADAASDGFRNRWYSRNLAALSEPALEPAHGARAYRFTWVRSFHHPVSVRVVATNDRMELFAAESDGAGGYDPGRVLRTTHVDLDRAQWTALEAQIERNGFWRMPAHEDDAGADGAQWILEGATDRYHVVDRWSPQSGPVRELGEQFLALTGWQFQPIERY